jgi:hypothetical protein
MSFKFFCAECGKKMEYGDSVRFEIYEGPHVEVCSEHCRHGFTIRWSLALQEVELIPQQVKNLVTSLQEKSDELLNEAMELINEDR